MPRAPRPSPAPAPAPEEPVLLKPSPGSREPASQTGPGLRRSEGNGGGYQEKPITPATIEADREAADNCALLHRARKSEDDGHAPAEQSPGAPAADRER